MRIKLLGKYYDFKFVKRLAKNYLGWCHTPETPQKKIRVKITKNYDELVDTCSHELMHGIFPSIDEDYVLEGNTDLINALKKLGFIRTEEEWKSSFEYREIFKREL